MHPILYQWGSFELRTYGLMLVVSFIAGLGLACYRARKFGLDQKTIADLFLLVLFSAVIGSRLLYVVENFSYYSSHPVEVLALSNGGLSMLGGVLLGILAIYWYTDAKGISFPTIADLLVPSLALGVFLTRIGCFFNGCCFGEACELPWAMTFPSGSDAGFQFPDSRIHPTQLYSSLYGLAIFGTLLVVEKRSTGPGYLFGLFLMLYGTSRFFVDFVRYYDVSYYPAVPPGLSLTHYQFISLGLFGMGWYFFLKAGRTRPQPADTAKFRGGEVWISRSRDE